MSHARVCALSELADGSASRHVVDGVALCVVRAGDNVLAVGDQCTHADVSLAEGEVDLDACTIECPRHGSEFSLQSGAPLSLPALKPTPVYLARVRDGEVEVELP
jgi:3-phenylpropionate/trans-cinnamate dioxygenase ferredoxin subunit